jgi:hypothetical protein
MAELGYARVSTADQDPALQLDALTKAGPGVPGQGVRRRLTDPG